MILLDKIIIAILCLFFLTGWIRGFLKSLIGPISFLCCFISAVIFYDLNRNILMATFIATIGTIAMAITLNILLAIGLSTVNKEFRGKTFLVSRILGSVVNVFWQGNIFFAFLILFSALPIKNEKFEVFQKQIPDSKMVAHYYQKVVNRDNRLKAIVSSLSVMNNPQKMQEITATKEFDEFYNHPKVQHFLDDPQVIDALAAKNSLRLIENASLRDLVTDDEAMYSLTKITRMVYEKNLENLGGLPENKPKR